MKILVTGAAGFIGFNLVKRLLDNGEQVVGTDNINEYYDPELKYSRLGVTGIARNKIKTGVNIASEKYTTYSFYKLDLEDREGIQQLFQKEKPDLVCHLAAQAGVRYSLSHPYTYIDSNIVGFINILEACKSLPVKHLVFASSSSVYGLNASMPFTVHDRVDHPISLYAATKKSNELLAHSYSYLYALPVTGLRFFTVYGPWGRPDMALFKFTKAILEEQPIEVYNHGNMERDFTYIDDIIEGVSRVIFRIPCRNKDWNGLDPDPSSSVAPYKLYNIGNNNPVKLLDFIDAIEKELGKKAIMNLLPLQPGDVPKTWSDTSDLLRDLNYQPSTDIRTGVKLFIQWFKNYYSH
jgi:UDP-glucuronate 4-epimerase